MRTGLGLLVTTLLASVPASATDRERDCLALPSESDVGKALRGIQFSAESQSRPVKDIRIVGLRSIGESELWRLYGGKPLQPTAENAAALLRQISRLGVFDTIDIGVDVDAGGSVIEFRVREQPLLQSVTINGLSEASRREVLRALLSEPPSGDVDGCPVGPPRGWVARVVDRDELKPGVLWRGLTVALDRVVDHLYDDGYEMASLKGTFSPDGTLTLDVDEGRITELQLHGVAPNIEAGVRKRLGLEPGQVFVASDLEHGLKRVKDFYPFLVKEEQDRWTRAQPELVLEGDAATGVRFHTADARCAGDSNSFGKALPGCAHPSSFYSIDGGRLGVHLKANRGSSSLSLSENQLLRITRVAGWSPGLFFETRVWDPSDRAHFSLDASFNVSVSRSSRELHDPGFFESLSAAERFEWHVAPKLQLPGLKLAEAGVQLHAFTDSSDNWRRAPLDVYLSSLFGSGSGVDYHRRAGFASFLTWRVEGLTAGAEYRIDRYDPMNSLSDQVENLPAAAGRIGAMLFRADWASERPSARIANYWRNPELPLYGARVLGDAPTFRTGVQTTNTVELARPSLGGDAQFDYTRFVSDTFLTLTSRDDHGVRLRLRGAGGKNLPPQKSEALGGWSTLRGFDYREFAGDYSFLAMAEYRFDFVSAFVDVGTVKQAGSWLDAKLGLGVALNGGDWGQLAFAWRTDERADSSPKIRLIFRRAF
jgi:hypothetical protein